MQSRSRKRARARKSLIRQSSWRALALTLLIAILVPASAARAADDASITGTVVDPLDARVSGATVKLLLNGQVAKEATSDGQGAFTFEALASGRYQIEAAIQSAHTARRLFGAANWPACCTSPGGSSTRGDWAIRTARTSPMAPRSRVNAEV